jgi:AcrR family transcriptional regulator
MIAVMAAAAGLRERKKQQTRQLIFDVAQRLFRERGFNGVTVAEVARAADLSEVTVFNYFPTKEDLFFGGMQFFEEQLMEAVRLRPKGESVLKAFRREVVSGAEGLGSNERIAAIQRAARIMAGSPSLRARERAIVDAYIQRLADIIGQETRSDPDDVEPVAVSTAMIGAHRALVDYTRKRVLAGRRGARLVEDFKAQARRVFGRLDRGLGDYAIKA